MHAELARCLTNFGCWRLSVSIDDFPSDLFARVDPQRRTVWKEELCALHVGQSAHGDCVILPTRLAAIGTGILSTLHTSGRRKLPVFIKWDLATVRWHGGPDE